MLAYHGTLELQSFLFKRDCCACVAVHAKILTSPAALLKCVAHQVRALEHNYPGGVRAYAKNARELLRSSAAGENPFEGMRPEVRGVARCPAAWQLPALACVPPKAHHTPLTTPTRPLSILNKPLYLFSPSPSLCRHCRCPPW